MSILKKVGWLTLLALAVVACSSQSDSGSTAANLAPPLDRSGACGGKGVPLPPEALNGPGRSGRDFMPNTAEANRQNLKSAWICSTDTTELDFKSGVQLEERSAPNDPTAMFQAMATDDKTASVVTLAHGPALVVDPTKDPSGTTVGGVDLVIGQDLLVVVGDGHMSVAALEGIANSLAPA